MLTLSPGKLQMQEHLAGDIPQNHMAVFRFAENGIRESLDDLSQHSNYIFLALGPNQRARKLPPLKLAFFKRLSYW